VSELSRRKVLRAISAGGVGGALAIAGGQYCGVAAALPRPRDVARTGDNLVVWENESAGSDAWTLGHGGTSGVDERAPQLHGYTSSTSVEAGGTIDFHLASHVTQGCTIAIYRVGHYGGARARHLLTSEQVRVAPRPRRRAVAVSGPEACDWPVSWSLDVPRDWVSGVFLAVFTSEDDRRAYAPFVVRDPARRSDILMVLPFTSYQAYNNWPLEMRTEAGPRSFQVSFDRPYARLGLPGRFGMDTSTARWAEEAGHDITYASDLDVHEGRIDPLKHTVVLFSGHDEFWSRQMRDSAALAVEAGTHLAFLAPCDTHRRIRLAPSGSGRPGRVMTSRAKASADQQPLRVPHGRAVRDTSHWLWSGTGLRDSDPLPPALRNIRLHEGPQGTLVFTAGGSHWPLALHEPEHADAQVQRVTANLLTRMLMPQEG
jgi:hypothetical protein